MPTHDTLTLTHVPFYLQDSLSAETCNEPVFAGVAMMDSVFAPREAQSAPTRPSLFSPHALAPTHTDSLPHNATFSPAWAFALLVVLVALLTLFFQQHKLRLTHLLQSLFSQRTQRRTLRDANMSRPTTLIVGALIMLASLGLGLTHYLSLSFLSGLLVFAALVAGYLLRNALIRMLGEVFNSSRATSAYITSNYLHHLALALLLLPLLFLYLFSPQLNQILIYALPIVIALEWVVRLMNGFQTFFSHTNSRHIHLFYYLCTVEMLPILMALRRIII